MRSRTSRRALLLAALAILAPPAGRAQGTGQITGTVTSNAGRPAGQYTTRVASLGDQAEERLVTVANGVVVTADFQLVVLAAALQQVVMVGYGEQKIGETTSAVTNVTADELVKGAARAIAQALAGKVPGLGITTPNDDPRDTSQMNLRGVTTTLGSTQPLIPLDDNPDNLETVPPTYVVESVSVLRDGSAAAIYGSGASNGVILVTTRKHSGGKLTLTYDSFFRTQNIDRRSDFLTAGDYRRPQADGKRSEYHAVFDGKLSADLNFVSRTQTHFDDGGSYSGAWRQTLLRNPTDRAQTKTGSWPERGTCMFTTPMRRILEQNGRLEGCTQRLSGTAMYRPFEGLRIAHIGGTSGDQNFVDDSFSANSFEFRSDLFGYDALQRGNAELFA